MPNLLTTVIHLNPKGNKLPFPYNGTDVGYVIPSGNPGNEALTGRAAAVVCRKAARALNLVEPVYVISITDEDPGDTPKWLKLRQHSDVLEFEDIEEDEDTSDLSPIEVSIDGEVIYLARDSFIALAGVFAEALVEDVWVTLEPWPDFTGPMLD